MHKTTQTHHGRNSQAAVSSSNAPSAPASLSVEQSSEGAVSSSGQASYTSGASVPSHSRSSAGVSSSSKRKYSEVDDGADGADDQPNLPKKAKKVERIAFIPIKVYGHQCIGILFTAGSIRGRGTVVFCVVDLDDHSKRLALKTSWQDLQREDEQDDVLERLKEKGSHPNLIIPFKNFKARTKNDDCTTLGTIRAFLGDQLHGFLVENRVLSVSLSELKRPVKYFWGVHDFVRGLRGAILGHEYLTRIGILHRDISENNIVLARRPGEERGYLIDFDMAILQEPEEPTEATVPSQRKGLRKVDPTARFSLPIPLDESKPLKALRTGTTPYMSMNVLSGGRHTYFDDMESFLYVVLLFFFSYAGPLSKEELRTADNGGFAQIPGSGRLSHLRRWPDTYAMWAEGPFRVIANEKNAALATQDCPERLIRSAEVRICLKDNWPTGLHAAIGTLLVTLWDLFVHNRLTSGFDVARTQVKHSEFVGCLDEWLAEYSAEEEEFSNCPFVRTWVTTASKALGGRATLVFCSVDIGNGSKLVAFKISSQDQQREREVGQYTGLLERREQSKRHPSLVVPLKDFKAATKNDHCTTLGSIKAFLGDQLRGYLMENRMLSVSLSELKRPVKYFWGVHDFVRGLRGAILGHEYLTQVGILHRDISENSIVLARRPGEERGCLIDFDMAILQEPEELTEATAKRAGLLEISNTSRPPSPIPPDESQSLKALRSGTTPYMSFNVLYGGKHTYFDDMESFLYVLLLFFFSYAGPLSKEELRAADNQGFFQLLGSGRLSHTRSWPDTYAMWADGAIPVISKVKDADLNSENCPKELVRSVEVRNCLKYNWDTGLHRSIQSLLLSLWTLFANSRLRAFGLNATRTQVKHGEFVDLLDKWLERFSGDEEKFSNCPFL
ncbi:kinase-like domain-containing protein [Melanogaster broomeanus]|nr:kinase-like domain-containing protein [Melanogaster broomeanus]